MELIEDKLELDKKEEFIQKNWDFKTWEESAQTIYDKLKAIALVKNNGKTNLYYDMTLVWNSSFVDAPVSGILRTQLILARYLSRIYPNIKFCAFTPNKYYELDKVMLSNILGMDAVDISFYNDKPKIRASVANQEKNNTHYNKVILKRSFWLMLSILPFNLQSKITKVVKRKFNRESFSNMENDIVSLPFKKGDIVFSAGAGYTKEIYKNLLQEHNNEKYYFVQLIYDYTPILVPQTHKKETIEHYIPFLKYSSELADVIFFGGKTAMRDGLKYQKENQQKICPAYAMKFGSNIIGKNPSKKRTKEVLDYYQISDNFILTVGSIEARKNHETLYQAYLKLIQQENTSIPQLVICGYPGWKTKDFISQLDNDERVRGKIIHGTFSDEELDILYRNCNFTVLPSLYEGWSLTLPESLNYGKFCIASDVDPLREIGQDFIDYVHPYDSDGWAEKILYYSDNFDKLKEKEEKIHTAWHTITWKECAENTANALDQLAKYGPQSFATTMEE